MLLGTLGVSLLGDIMSKGLFVKGVIRAAEGTIRAGKRTIRADYGSNKSSLKTF